MNIKQGPKSTIQDLRSPKVADGQVPNKWQLFALYSKMLWISLVNGGAKGGVTWGEKKHVYRMYRITFCQDLSRSQVAI